MDHGDQLDQSQQNHEKRDCRQDNKKGRLRGVNGHFVLAVFINDLFSSEDQPNHEKPPFQ